MAGVIAFAVSLLISWQVLPADAVAERIILVAFVTFVAAGVSHMMKKEDKERAAERQEQERQAEIQRRFTEDAKRKRLESEARDSEKRRDEAARLEREERERELLREQERREAQLREEQDWREHQLREELRKREAELLKAQTIIEAQSRQIENHPADDPDQASADR